MTMKEVEAANDITDFPTDTALEAAVTALFDHSVFGGAVRIGTGWGDAFLQRELEALGRVSETRRNEFIAGRLALRRAQMRMEQAPFALFSGIDRCPVWPEGYCGSITHAGNRAVAVLSSTDVCKSLGLDIETNTPLEENLLPAVLTPAERNSLGRYKIPLSAAKIMFSIKESVYKAQYPLTGVLFGFDGITLTLDEQTHEFEAEFVINAGMFERGDRIHGRYTERSGMILTGASISW